MTGSLLNTQQLRLLVAIASYGEKNLRFLKRILEGYQAMPLTVDVVVLSEAPKDLGEGVRVVVGLPAKDPWSLPFAHKAIFAREVDNYDLFLYSEDDIQFTARNLEAFLRATSELAPDEIAGFLLYEEDQLGTKWLPGFWAHFHWKPESVRRRGQYTVAEFTNDHSASYLLTQAQLRRAIASGGFLREPYEGRYDLLCTAATDPYTSCGFRKVICISALEDFLVHHTPDRYTGISHVSLPSLQEQIQALLDIRDGSHPACTLCERGPEFWHGWWQKPYYEKAKDAVVDLVPREAKTILSIGCGFGATEVKLQQRGAKITALPLDSVIGAAAVRRGFEVIYGTWNECFERLEGRHFDCVLMTDLLHLQPCPEKIVEQCSRLVRAGGSVVLSGPNFGRIPWLLKRILGVGEFKKLRRFDASGINVVGPGSLTRHMQSVGLRVTAVQWIRQGNGHPIRGDIMRLGRFTAGDWLLQAHR